MRVELPKKLKPISVHKTEKKVGFTYRPHNSNSPFLQCSGRFVVELSSGKMLGENTQVDDWVEIDAHLIVDNLYEQGDS